MALNQLSVFVDNTPGALSDIAEILANADINLRALSIADTERFGILRMIVSDNRMATSALKGKGYIVKETEVVGVKIGDAPGKMAEALKVLDLAGINLEYGFLFVRRTKFSWNVAFDNRLWHT